MRIKVENAIGSMAVIRHNDARWVSNQRFNGLYKLQGNKCEFIGHFNGPSIDRRNIHYGATIWENRCLFFPYFGNLINWYNPESNEFGELDLSAVGIKEYVVHDSVKYNGKLYLIPKYKDMPVVLIDEKFNIEIVKCDYSNILNKNKDFCEDSICCGKLFYGVPIGKNTLIQLDLETFNINKVVLPFNIKNYCDFNNSFCFLSDDGYIVLCDRKLNIIKRIKLQDKLCVTYVKMLTYKNRIILVPLKGRSVINVDIETEDVTVISVNAGHKSRDEVVKYKLFTDCEIIDNNLILFPMGLREQIVIDLESFEQQEKLFEVDLDSVPEMEYEIVSEEFCSLNDFLEQLLK